MIYPADCVGLWAWPIQWFPTLHGVVRNRAETCHGLAVNYRGRFRIVLGSSD